MWVERGVVATRNVAELASKPAMSDFTNGETCLTNIGRWQISYLFAAAWFNFPSKGSAVKKRTKELSGGLQISLGLFSAVVWF